MPPQGFGSQTGMLPIQPQYNQMHQQQTPPQQNVYATQSSYGSNQVCHHDGNNFIFVSNFNFYRNPHRICHSTINRYTCHLAQIKIKFSHHQCTYSRIIQTVPFMYQRINKRQVYQTPSVIIAYIIVNSSSSNNNKRPRILRLMVYLTITTIRQQHKYRRRFHRLHLSP